MRKHFCDLCGKEISNTDSNTITLDGYVIHPTPGIPGICNPNKGATEILKEIEVCKDCLTDMLVELNKKYHKVSGEDLYNREKCSWFDNLMKDRETL